MGLFGHKKPDLYERNTRIAELESKLEAVTAKMEKLKIENAELRSSIANVKASNEALLTENDALGYNLKTLRQENGKIASELDEVSVSDEDREAHKQIESDKKKAFELKQTAIKEYALELKRLKLFSEKWQAYFEDETTMKKQELVNLLTDLLKNSDSVEFALSAKAKMDEIYKTIGEPISPQAMVNDYFDSEENGFNLDEAVQPKSELDLEDLCKELGVFEG